MRSASTSARSSYKAGWDFTALGTVLTLAFFFADVEILWV
jgi:hypothetical protein